MAQILKSKQQQLQQQKMLAAVAASGAQANTVQTLSPQAFAQAIQQAGSSGTQVATLVKAGGKLVTSHSHRSCQKIIRILKMAEMHKGYQSIFFVLSHFLLFILLSSNPNRLDPSNGRHDRNSGQDPGSWNSESDDPSAVAPTAAAATAAGAEEAREPEDNGHSAGGRQRGSRDASDRRVEASVDGHDDAAVPAGDQVAVGGAARAGRSGEGAVQGDTG